MHGRLEFTYRVPADGRIVAQILRFPDPAGGWVDAIESLHDDHLGSTHVVTDDNGDVEHTIAYDPWGQARTGDADARSLGRHCDPGVSDCYRPIVVGDPDMAGSADTWNRAEQMFEGQQRPRPGRPRLRQQQPPRQPLLPQRHPARSRPACDDADSTS